VQLLVVSPAEVAEVQPNSSSSILHYYAGVDTLREQRQAMRAPCALLGWHFLLQPSRLRWRAHLGLSTGPAVVALGMSKLFVSK
jgi:hypothetical protein